MFMYVFCVRCQTRPVQSSEAIIHLKSLTLKDNLISGNLFKIKDYLLSGSYFLFQEFLFCKRDHMIYSISIHIYQISIY